MTVSPSRSFVLIGTLLLSALAFPLLALSVSVAIAPSVAALATSQTQQFTATVTGSANTAVTWSINPSVGTISTAGLYTAPSTINGTSQTVTVIATSQADTTKSAGVTVTIEPAKFDDIAPNFISISSPTGTINALTQQQSVTVTAVALDPLDAPVADGGIASGVSYAYIQFSGPTCAQPTYSLPPNYFLVLEPQGAFVEGQNQTLSGTLQVSPDSTPGTYYACYAYVYDAAGNYQYYNNEYGQTSALLQALPSFQVLANGTPPVLTSFTLSPSPADVTSGAQTITATLSATDSGPGVSLSYPSYVYLYAVSAGGVYQYSYSYEYANWTLLSGTSTNGTFQVQLKIPQYSVPGTWMAYVSLCDTNSLCKYYQASDLQTANFTSSVIITDSNPDTTPPQLTSISLVQNGNTLSTNLVEPDFQNQRNPITVNVTAADNLSGVQWRLPNYCSYVYVTSILTNQYVYAYFTANASSPSEATTQFDIPYLGSIGQWNVTVHLCDNTGNQSTYTAPAAQLGQFASIYVLYPTSSQAPAPIQGGQPVCALTACVVLPQPSVTITGNPSSGKTAPETSVTVSVTVTPTPPVTCNSAVCTAPPVFTGFKTTGGPYVTFTLYDSNGNPIVSPTLTPPGATITIPGVAPAGTPESAWASYVLWSIDNGTPYQTPACSGYTFGPTNVTINADGSVTYANVCNFSTFFVLQQTGVAGDVNHDGVVNCTDVDIVKAAFGTKTGQALFNANADVNNDGVVNILDLSFVSKHLPSGTVCH